MAAQGDACDGPDPERDLEMRSVGPADGCSAADASASSSPSRDATSPSIDAAAAASNADVPEVGSAVACTTTFVVPRAHEAVVREALERVLRELGASHASVDTAVIPPGGFDPATGGVLGAGTPPIVYDGRSMVGSPAGDSFLAHPGVSVFTAVTLGLAVVATLIAGGDERTAPATLYYVSGMLALLATVPQLLRFSRGRTLRLVTTMEFYYVVGNLVVTVVAGGIATSTRPAMTLGSIVVQAVGSTIAVVTFSLMVDASNFTRTVRGVIMGALSAIMVAFCIFFSEPLIDRVFHPVVARAYTQELALGTFTTTPAALFVTSAITVIVFQLSYLFRMFVLGHAYGLFRTQLVDVPATGLGQEAGGESGADGSAAGAAAQTPANCSAERLA